MPADPQLSLFGASPATADVAPIDDPAARDLAARVPPFVRLGTSSWTFPGWAGLVYAGKPTQAQLAASGLRAYARHPLLRTVGIDRSHYAPLSDAELTAYAAQLPPGFLAVSKVWDEVTTLIFPKHPRFGARAGARNGRFLDPEIALESVVAPYLRSFAAHAGPMLLEIPPLPRDAGVPARAFLEALDRFLAAMPRTLSWAVELRSRELFSRSYLDVLARHGAAHVLNFWTAMPTVGRQLAIPGILTAPFVVCRLLLPPGTRYEAMREEFAPFDRIVSPQPEMRTDVVRLARACQRAGRTLFVLVNNKAEGSSPLTVLALAEALADAFTCGR